MVCIPVCRLHPRGQASGYSPCWLINDIPVIVPNCGSGGMATNATTSQPEFETVTSQKKRHCFDWGRASSLTNTGRGVSVPASPACSSIVKCHWTQPSPGATVGRRGLDGFRRCVGRQERNQVCFGHGPCRGVQPCVQGNANGTRRVQVCVGNRRLRRAVFPVDIRRQAVLRPRRNYWMV
jgi:hypothetical protein